MESISTFLLELQKRIITTNTPVTEYENKKNELIEFRNILLKYEIASKELSFEDFIRFNEEDVKEIIKMIDETKIQTVLDYLEALKSLDKDTPQYKEVSILVSSIVKEINDYVISFTERNKEYIDSLKKSIESPKSIFESFKKEELTRPIINIREFHNILDTLNLSMKDKYEIKKYVGQKNCELITGNVKEKQKDTEKYQVLLDLLKNKVEDKYSLIKGEQITFNDAQTIITLLSEKYSWDLDSTKEAVICVLLENNLNEYEKNQNDPTLDSEFKQEYAKTIFAELDKIYALKNKKLEVKQEIKEEKPLSEDEQILEEVKTIIVSEQDTINKVDEKELNSYLAQNIAEENQKTLIYKIVSVLLALNVEIEKFKNSEGNKYVHDITLGNIRQYIEAYNILKEKQKNAPEEEKEDTTKKEENYLFLTDNNNEPFILDDIEKVEQIYLNKVRKLIEYNIGENNLSQMKSFDIHRDATVYMIKDSDVRLVFMKAANDINLILCASIKSENTKKKTQTIFDNYKTKIEQILEQTKNPKEIRLLLDEQASIRSSLIQKLEKTKK